MSLESASAKLSALALVRRVQESQRAMEALVVDLLANPDASIDQIGEARSALLRTRAGWAEVEPLLARSAIGRYVKDAATRAIGNARGPAR